MDMEYQENYSDPGIEIIHYYSIFRHYLQNKIEKAIDKFVQIFLPKPIQYLEKSDRIINFNFLEQLRNHLENVVMKSKAQGIYPLNTNVGNEKEWIQAIDDNWDSKLDKTLRRSIAKMHNRIDLVRKEIKKAVDTLNTSRGNIFNLQDKIERKVVVALESMLNKVRKEKPSNDKENDESDGVAVTIKPAPVNGPIEQVGKNIAEEIHNAMGPMMAQMSRQKMISGIGGITVLKIVDLGKCLQLKICKWSTGSGACII